MTHSSVVVQGWRTVSRQSQYCRQDATRAWIMGGDQLIMRNRQMGSQQWGAVRWYARPWGTVQVIKTQTSIKKHSVSWFYVNGGLEGGQVLRLGRPLFERILWVFFRWHGRTGPKSRTHCLLYRCLKFPFLGGWWTLFSGPEIHSMSNILGKHGHQLANAKIILLMQSCGSNTNINMQTRSRGSAVLQTKYQNGEEMQYKWLWLWHDCWC